MRIRKEDEAPTKSAALAQAKELLEKAKAEEAEKQEEAAVQADEYDEVCPICHIPGCSWWAAVRDTPDKEARIERAKAEMQ